MSEEINSDVAHIFSQEVINKAVNWFLNFESGASSKIIFATILSNGNVKRIGTFETHPTCTSDFSRCLALFECVPEFKEHLYLMREVSPTWSKFVDRWEEIANLYLTELDEQTGFTTKAAKLIMEIQE